MTDMLEKVARALHDADWRQQVGLTSTGEARTWENNPDQEWWLRQARAALLALREPANWPMDIMAELLTEAGIEQPRPSEVLRVFFDAALGDGHADT